MVRKLKRTRHSKRRSYERKIDEPIAITPVEYGGLQEAFDHFNAVLFERTLPDVFITYQRKANSAGYFSADRFSGRVGKWGKHELALNPDGFINQTDEQVTQTLVHEMVHVWQHAFGKPSARGYHNKALARAVDRMLGANPISRSSVCRAESRCALRTLRPLLNRTNQPRRCQCSSPHRTNQYHLRRTINHR
jgi:predicted SprT family Zn-dependent metalloprotease